MVLDIVASKRGQEPDFAMIELFAGECFMPLCYGGGVRTVDQAARIFDLEWRRYAYNLPRWTT